MDDDRLLEGGAVATGIGNFRRRGGRDHGNHQQQEHRADRVQIGLHTEDTDELR